jgi:hypothetical protein
MNAAANQRRDVQLDSGFWLQDEDGCGMYGVPLGLASIEHRNGSAADQKGAREVDDLLRKENAFSKFGVGFPTVWREPAIEFPIASYDSLP